MSTKFHFLTVRDVRRETPDCVSVSFDVPADLADAFRFLPGQYLTLRTDIDGDDVRRSYSICTSPSQHDLRVAIKRVRGGVFSNFADSVLKAGDTLQVMPPQGRFALRDDAPTGQHLVGVAAGSGITPVMSIMQAHLERDARNTFTLLYGNRSKSGIIFREQIEQLKNRYMERLTVFHVLSRDKTEAPIFSGRIDEEKCGVFFSKLVDIQSVDSFYLCGPEEMIFTVKDCLTAMGVPAEKVHFELFTTADSKKKVATVEDIPLTDRDKLSQVTVRLDGLTFDFELPYHSESILDAACDQGADLPFSCKGGVCCTCKAKLLEGQVEMAVNYALEPDEVAAGYILTCQSRPRSERIVVDFDSGH